MTAHADLPKLFRTSEQRATYGTLLAYGPAGAGKTYSIRTPLAHDFIPGRGLRWRHCAPCWPRRSRSDPRTVDDPLPSEP
jgi:hypothetical protein